MVHTAVHRGIAAGKLRIPGGDDRPVFTANGTAHRIFEIAVAEEPGRRRIDAAVHIVNGDPVLVRPTEVVFGKGFRNRGFVKIGTVLFEHLEEIENL